MFKKLLILTFVMIISISLSGCKSKQLNDLDAIIKRDKIIIGVQNEFRPFGFLENGELKGIDIDIARYITKSILGDETKAEFKIVNSADRLLTLGSGEVDIVIATMSVTPQRQMIINFSKPYYIAGQTVLVRKESDIKSLSDLNNKKIVVVFGTTAEKSLRVVIPNATVVGTKNYKTAFEMLKSKHVEGIAADDTILSTFAENDNHFRLLNKRYTIEPYAIGYRKSKLSETLGAEINSILDEMRTSGKLKEIERKWIK